LVIGCQAASPARSATAPEVVAPSSATPATTVTTQPNQAQVARAEVSDGDATTPQHESFEQQLAQRVKDQPRELAPQLDQQLWKLIHDESVPDGAIAALPPDDRDLLATLCDGLAQFRASARGGGSVLLTSKVQPFTDMTEKMRVRAGLTLPAVVLCKSVSQFGVYEPFAPARFDAGKETPVIIYCEVANFASKQAAGDQWETKLGYEAAVYKENDAAMPVIGKKPTNIVDRCRNRRHDFFVADRITLPPSLAAGNYVLKVTIVDQQANRITEATVPLSVAAPAATAR
jgi:hypothetical protein